MVGKKGAKKSHLTGTTAVTASLSNIQLGSEQQTVFDKLEYTNDNYFVTGKAGTGKSVLLAYFMAHTKKEIAVLAPTGVAALNVAGQTIHSFYNMSPTFQNVFDVKERHRLRSNNRDVIKKLDAIVIDEISMVRSDVLTMLDAKTRYARRSHKPFGGCQMIFFGDPYQLPPIGFSEGENIHPNGTRYKSHYFFDTTSFRNAGISKFELGEVFRQKDAKEIEILNRIRHGDRSRDLLDMINEKCCRRLPEDEECITLTARNAEANSINDTELAKIDAPLVTIRGRLDGTMKISDCNTPIELKLKVGAQVMMTKNDSVDYERGVKTPRWINGTLATVTGFDDDTVRVRIGNKEYEVEPAVWEKYAYVEEYDEETEEMVIKRKVAGRFTQYPMKLAYAITVHKSQGQTYDAVKIDLGRGAFETGQTYVALSRCRSLENLFLERPLKASDIQVDERVVRWMSE